MLGSRQLMFCMPTITDSYASCASPALDIHIAKLISFIDRVNKADIAAPDSKNHPRGSTAALNGHETILPL